MKRLLITGASGRIASAFIASEADRYEMRLADRDIASLDAADGAIAMDIADPIQCRSACEGIDTVLHLAADPDPDADFYDSLIDANIKGSYNIFRAAKDAGCKRIVFASSAQTIEGYPPDRQVSVSDPVRPGNLYGVTKCFGEALASYFAHQEGLSAICIRIANFNHFDGSEDPSPRDAAAYLSHADAVQILRCAIDQPDIRFAIVNAVSNNRHKRLTIDEAVETLGYAPVDDSFAILGR